MILVIFKILVAYIFDCYQKNYLLWQLYWYKQRCNIDVLNFEIKFLILYCHLQILYFLKRITSLDS